MVKDIIIDQEYGHILLPLHTGQQLNLDDFNWLKVDVKSDHMVLSPFSYGVDDDFLETLINEGVLIDPK